MISNVLIGPTDARSQAMFCMKEILFTARIPNEAHCYRISTATIHRQGGMIRCWSCRRILDIGAMVISLPQARGKKIRCLACSILMGVLALELPHEFNICKCGHQARSIETFRRHVQSIHHSDRYSTWLVEKGVGNPPPLAVAIGLDGTVERIDVSEN